jgi:hypothetical protein
MPNAQPASSALMRRLALVLGIFSFTTLLASYHIADGDLWAKLAIGAQVWLRGEIPNHDQFAFTPTLPAYVDHEWGAGTIFFGWLQWFGPRALMALKILLAFGALAAALDIGRRLKVNTNALLVLTIPAAACLLPGYGPVIRSHAFTYCFFGVTLLCLEAIRDGKKWAAFTLPLVMLVWTNVHGGCVAGLGTIGVYAGWALLTRQHFKTFLLVALASFAATFVNPQGAKFWTVLLPAVLHPRARITEWLPLPLWGNDPFIAFRLLFVIVLLLLAWTWRGTEKKSWPGLVMLMITAVLGWRSRRHAPFFAVTTLAFVAPFLATALAGWAERFRRRIQPAVAVAALHGAVAIYAAMAFLPRASFEVLAPIGHDPVREMDILSLAEVEGNLATPFGWGSYCAWRLHPRVKISMDGRYEAAFPESTFAMNNDFYDKRGTNWDRLLRDFDVDFVLLEYQQERLRPADLADHGYQLIWEYENHSALLVKEKHAAKLRRVAAELPPTTINPLDAAIPARWWPK